MNNEIGRKITSLTLMTIMLAGGMTIAAPGFMPAAHAANANLFVSAENSQFDNYMSGPQVIEVVVIDSDINDTDEGKGEPDVTVSGKKLRMAQAIDGNWYGYFADKAQAVIADATVGITEGQGLDFGLICTAVEALAVTDVDFSDTVGVALQRNTADTCAKNAPTPNILNVVREAKLANPTNAANAGGVTDVDVGQIQIDTAGEWPFIQLYTLSPGGNVNILYNKGGGDQSVSLTFDTVDQYASVSLDRTVYTQSAEVHATITDLWLNIDPTDEDSWTFGTSGTPSTHYQVFDENGLAVGDNADNMRITTTSLTGKLKVLMCEDNCVLKTNPNVQGTGNVFTLQDNDDSALENVDTINTVALGGDEGTDNNADEPLDWRTEGDQLEATIPVTITEQGPNSGIFGTYDEADTSNIILTKSALRGTSGSIEYNEKKQTILVGNSFATIDIQPIDDEWSSGEEIPIILVDSDANKNSRADEDLDLFNPDNSIIPALSTGSPFTLDTGDTFIFYDSILRVAEVSETSDGSQFSAVVEAGSTLIDTVTIDRFSKRAILNADGSQSIDMHSSGTTNGNALDTAGLVVAFTGRTVADLKEIVRLPSALAAVPGVAVDTKFEGFNYFSYDIRSFDKNQDPDGHALLQTDVYLIVSSDEISAANLVTVGNTCIIDLAMNASLQERVVLTQDTYDFLYGDASNNNCAIDPNTAGSNVGIFFALDDLDTDNSVYLGSQTQAITADFTSFGFIDDGVQSDERIADQIVRLELEESGDNTSSFEGTLEYIMVNQLTINTQATYDNLSTIDNEASFIVIEDLTDEDSIRVTYNDLGADGVVTQVSDQEEAPSHSGVVSFDSKSYKIADTVVVTLEDADLNTDSDLIDIYTVVTAGASKIASNADGKNYGNTYDVVGTAASKTLSWGELGRLLDITFNDLRWSTPDTDLDGDSSNTDDSEVCGANLIINNQNTGLGNTGFTLVESSPSSGVFIGDFQIPKQHCAVDAVSLKDTGDTAISYTWGTATTKPITTTGVDIEVNYVDFRDASGEIIEVGYSAGIRANTGSISLDRTVYPVPFGQPADHLATIGTAPAGDSIFAVHASGFNTGDRINTAGHFLTNGDLTIHIRVNDPDFDTSATGEDTIGQARGQIGDVNITRGPVKISVIRGSNNVDIGFVGGAAVSTGKIGIGNANTPTLINAIREFGPMSEIAPDAGIFEADVVIAYTDGPSSTLCPNTEVYRLLGTASSGLNHPDTRFTGADISENADFCILQGDILQVEYEDPEDASGNANTVTDSATFDLRNGVLQSDKSVYIIGSDMILTLIEPDFDLDNDTAETYDLDLIEWASDAATITMGDLDGEIATFDPEPTDFRETGDSTGIFQIVIEMPEVLANDRLERGEEITLEFTDWGPSGADYIGQEKEDVNLTVFTSNFGATVELDQKVYTWTDKVYITIVAPDHNFDRDLVDTIGETALDPVKVSTRGFNIDRYSLVETGTDTGIFTGEVILVGFGHDADGKLTTGATTTGFDKGTQETSTDGAGPTDGLLQTDNDDGLTVSFEFSEDESVVGSSLIRWNIGVVQWLEASYPASGTGVVRVIDPDMNLNPEAVDNYTVDVWSDSDAGGIDLTVTETNEATGIFEGTVFFTVDDESSGHRLRVAEGDTVTSEYEDNTLPDPYTRADELDISATTLIGTIVPPLERAPAANLRTVDAFGNSLDTVSIDQQVQISADLANGQDREQSFAYLVQIQDGNGVTVSLAWITGSLSAGQSFSPALSWIPTQAGTYTVTAFVWESVDNPTALSPPVSTKVLVQ